MAIVLLALFSAPLHAQQPRLKVAAVSAQEVRLSWPEAFVDYILEDAAGLTGTVVWTAVAASPQVQAGERVVRVPVGASNRFYRLRQGKAGLTTVRSSSPSAGEGNVAVTRETILRLSAPLAPTAVVGNDRLYAMFGGRRILSRVELSTDRSTLTLFYLEPLPGRARIRVTFDGDGLNDAAGQAVDADGDGKAGGKLVLDFDTLANGGVAGTVVTGRVFASELAQAVAAQDALVNRPLAGVRITVDGSEQDLFAVTDNLGNFRLDPAPAGPFFVHIDGRTVAVPGGGYPKGPYYPFVGKEWVSRIGEEVNIGNIFLPLIQEQTLQPVSATKETAVTFPAAILQQHPELNGVQLTVPANALFSDDGKRGGLVGIAPVAPDRLPSALPAGLNFPLVITVQTDGASNFDSPVPVCFPNLPDPVTGVLKPPGAKSALWSFNHDLGDWEIIGPMTVSDDGKLVCTDPGVGILQPGWHGSQEGSRVTDGGITSGGDARSPQEKGPQHAPRACPSPIVPCPPGPDNGTDPVHLFSGEFYEEVVDLKIPGRGFDFVWSRLYRSKIGRPSIQGYGWDSSYGNVAIRARGTDLLLNDGGGREDVYPRQPDGTWSQREFFRQFTRRPDGVTVLTFEDQGRWEFHPLDGTPSAGRLASSVDRNGNAMRFGYDAQGKLTTITDTLDRNIVIAYNADGYIGSVTDFAGRSVRYEYYNGVEPGGNRGDLKAVFTPPITDTPTGNDFPNGKQTTYTYTTGFVDERLNHNLLSITDGRRNDPGDPTFGQGPYLINVYAQTEDPKDPNFDRVVRQIWGGDSFDYVYVPILPSEANGHVVMRSILRDRVGNVREFFFDDHNRVARLREYTGRSDPTRPTTAVDNRPAGKLRTTDPEFFETLNEWTEDSLLRRTVQPNGNIVERVYEIDLNPAASPRTRGNLRIVRHLPGSHLPVGDQAVIEEKFEYTQDFGAGCCGFNFVTRVTDGRGNSNTYSYDDKGNRIRTQHRDSGIVEEWEYNAFGQATAHIQPANAEGHRRRDVRTYYDTGPQRGYVRSDIIDSGGLNLTTTHEYDAVGNIVRIIDPSGHDSLFMRNALNQVVRESSPEVGLAPGLRYHRDYYYDANGNIVRLDVLNVDDRGLIQPNRQFSTLWEYEILNEPVRVSQEVDDTRTIVSEFGYDANRNRILMRSGEAVSGRQSGNTVRWEFDERNQMYRVVRAPNDPLQSTTQYDYDGNSNPVRLSVGLEAGARVSQMVFDAHDRLVSATDPMGNARRYFYDANGNEVRQVVEGQLADTPGGAGNVRLMEIGSDFDAMNRAVRERVSFFDIATQTPIGDGSVTTERVFAPNSHIRRVVNDNGHAALFSYDTANRLIAVTDARGNVTRQTYDSSDNLVSVTTVEKSDRGGSDQTFVTAYGYDPLDRLAKITDNAGHLIEFGYDSRNNRTFTLDASRATPTGPGNRTSYAYDGINRLFRTTRFLTSDGTGAGAPAGSIVMEQGWDDNSRLTFRTDGKGQSTRYFYDVLDRLVETVYPDGTARRMEFNSLGNLAATTDPNGTLIRFTYDLMNRLTRKDIAPAPGVAADTTFETWQYDGLSRAVRAANDMVEVVLGYDSLGNMTSDSIGGLTSRMQYDGLGNLNRMIYPSGRVVNSTFDELERLKTIQDATLPTPRAMAAYDYVGPGRVEQRRSGNNTRLDYAYDAVKRTVRSAHTLGQNQVFDDRGYGWDARFNRTQHRELLPGGTVQTYNYDSVNRLVQTVFSGASTVQRSYQLDAAGNRVAVTGGPDAGAYSMDVGAGLDAQVNQYTATPFDVRAYDENGNLRRAVALTSDKVFAYDYQNRLVQHAQGGSNVRYVYDPLGRRVARLVVGAPAVSVQYSYAGWNLCEERDINGNTLATYVHGRQVNEVVSLRSGGQDYWLHADDLFSVRQVTDDAGRVVEGYSYDDFGVPSIFDSASNPLAASRVRNPFMFTGHRYDAETGLYYARSREYEPRSGRFLTRDPLGNWADPVNLGNGTTYVGNNPASYIDPYGLWSLFRAVLTGDGNAPDDVYDAARTQFQETLWDRTDATVRTLTAGHADALSVVRLATGEAFTTPRDPTEQSHVFDPMEQAKQACFTRCWAVKTANAIFGAVLGDDKLGNVIGEGRALAANVASVAPINWVSGAMGSEDFRSWETKDQASVAAGTAGMAARLGGNLASGRAARAAADMGLSSAKQFLRGGNPYREMLAAQRSAAGWRQWGDRLGRVGNGLAAVSLIIDLKGCYDDCERDPCAWRMTYAERLGELMSQYYD